MIKDLKSDYYSAVLLAGIAAVVFFPRLGTPWLWQDEAQTALVSRSILQYGVPKGRDNLNSFSQEDGAEFGKDYIWKWHSWLPFYVLAGFFAVFGENTFTARLPFCLFGVATVVLTYFWAKWHWRSRRIASIAAILLAFWVPFILLARQCRFYSMSAFFSLLALHSYIRFLEHRKHSTWHFLLSTTLLFHTFHFYACIYLLCILFHAVFFARKAIGRVMLLASGAFFINLPWFIWFSGMHYTHGQRDMPKLLQYLSILGERLWTEAFPLPWLLAVIAGLLYVHRSPAHARETQKSIGSNLMLLLIYITANYLAVCAVAPGLHFRYFAPLIAPGCLIAALAIEEIFIFDRMLAVILTAFIILGQPLGEYIFQLTHPYPGFTERVVSYLQLHAKPTDTLLISYGDLPFKFYTRMRVYGGLTGEDLNQAREADWIILHYKSPNTGVTGRRVYDFVAKNIPRDKYQAILLDCPDSLWENREDVQMHKFREDPGLPSVILYKRLRLPNDA